MIDVGIEVDASRVDQSERGGGDNPMVCDPTSE
jgi:hypothetical protein